MFTYYLKSKAIKNFKVLLGQIPSTIKWALGCQPPSKSSPHLFFQVHAAPLNLITVQVAPPLSTQFPLYIGFREHLSPLQIGFFSEHPKYLNFPTLTLFHLLKVTKFLVQISRFKFLVMTEKHIFVYKLFLSLNI